MGNKIIVRDREDLSRTEITNIHDIIIEIGNKIYNIYVETEDIETPFIGIRETTGDRINIDVLAANIIALK